MTAIPPQIAQLRATLQQALQHHQAGRLSEAERLYRSILKVRPDDPEINNALGIALKGQGKPDAAAAAFQRAVAAADDSLRGSGAKAERSINLGRSEGYTCKASVHRRPPQR